MAEPFDIPVATAVQATRVEAHLPSQAKNASAPMKLGGSGSPWTQPGSNHFADPSTSLSDVNKSWTSDANDFGGISAAVPIRSDPPGMELGWGLEDVSPMSSPNLGSGSGLSREEKQAELRRKREESRKRMQEAKEKKKAGAKQVTNANIKHGESK